MIVESTSTKEVGRDIIDLDGSFIRETEGEGKHVWSSQRAEEKREKSFAAIDMSFQTVSVVLYWWDRLVSRVLLFRSGAMS